MCVCVSIYPSILCQSPPKEQGACVGPELISKVLGKGNTCWWLLQEQMFLSCCLRFVLLVTFFIPRSLWWLGRSVWPSLCYWEGPYGTPGTFVSSHSCLSFLSLWLAWLVWRGLPESRVTISVGCFVYPTTPFHILLSCEKHILIGAILFPSPRQHETGGLMLREGFCMWPLWLPMENKIQIKITPVLSTLPSPSPSPFTSSSTMIAQLFEVVWVIDL